MLADRPEGVDQVMPVYLWAGVGVVVLLVVVLGVGWWQMFGLPRRTPKPQQEEESEPEYVGRRRVDSGNPNQVRPADVSAALTSDKAIEFVPLGEPLAIESSPRPYRYASRAQHKEPLAEELTW